MAKKKRDYRHIDKDPVIDLIRTGIQQSGRTAQDVAENAGLSPDTIYKWLYRDTKRPQNYSIDVVLLELGIARTAVWIETGIPVMQPTRKLRLVK